ncbi:MAG: hypothetical protein CMJ88_08385 [Planctomycetes bacterium]|nr:hypothetical protein [Planctomycetota bacterium]
MTSQDNATTWRLCLAAILAALLASVLRLAWLFAAALITFRSVENLIQGYGPVWNVDERVQTYTHPLWFWLLALTRWTTGECAVSAVALGGLLSATSVGLLWRLRRNTAALAVAVALLLGSRTWSNFATSGLETSLVYVLATTLAVVYRDAEPDRRLRRTAIVVGLARWRLDSEPRRDPRHRRHDVSRAAAARRRNHRRNARRAGRPPPRRYG